jgi:hypothetical protein
MYYVQWAALSLFLGISSTYDHRVWRTGLPVRSAVLKPHAGRLVVGWVTTSESLLLYVFFFIYFFLSPCLFFCGFLKCLVLVFCSCLAMTDLSRYLVAGTTIWSGLSYVFSNNAVKILSNEEVQKRIAQAAAKRKP